MKLCKLMPSQKKMHFGCERNYKDHMISRQQDIQKVNDTIILKRCRSSVIVHTYAFKYKGFKPPKYQKLNPLKNCSVKFKKVNFVPKTK